MFKTIFVLMILCPSAMAQEAISSFDKKNISVLNEELRVINGKVRQLNGGLPIASTTGILAVSRGGTGQDFSAATIDTLMYFNGTGTLGLSGSSGGDSTKFLNGGFTFTSPTYSQIVGNYAAGTYLIGGPGIFQTGYDPGSTYEKFDEIYIPRGGTLRIKFWMALHTGSTVSARIYRNGSAVGTEQTTTSTSVTEYSEDISGWSAGDLVQLYIKDDTGYWGGMTIYELTPATEAVGTVSSRPPRIYWGVGVPPGAICTQGGDLFLRNDGSTTTSLYVCSSPSTWTAK